MPRNMSFSMTKEQFKNRSKTITRRLGWWFLKPGDVVCGVEKAMGLKKGERIKRLGLIRIVDTRCEPLWAITPADVIREGFPEFTTTEFVNMLMKHHGVGRDVHVNRIEFEYIFEK
jgi:hypothetical protein